MELIIAVLVLYQVKITHLSTNIFWRLYVLAYIFACIFLLYKVIAKFFLYFTIRPILFINCRKINTARRGRKANIFPMRLKRKQSQIRYEARFSKAANGMIPAQVLNINKHTVKASASNCFYQISAGYAVFASLLYCMLGLIKPVFLQKPLR